jgi:hypothetical protein
VCCQPKVPCWGREKGAPPAASGVGGDTSPIGDASCKEIAAENVLVL